MVFSLRPIKIALIAAVAAVLLVAGCKRGPLTTGEYAYVGTVQVTLRDRVATVYNKVGSARNGEKLEVLDHQKSFVKVRTPRGEEGWVEQRFLVDPDIYQAFQKLATDSRNTPIQGKGKTRAELNMHVTPARDAESLYQLAEGEMVEILARATAERKTQQEIQAKRLAEAREAALDRQIDEAKKRQEREAAKKKKDAIDIPQPEIAPPEGWDQKTPPELLEPSEKMKARQAANKKQDVADQAKPYDDWWLVRNKQGQVGWVLARMVDLDLPLEIVTYFEGQRAMGAWVLNTVKDSEQGDKPQYLVVLNDPKEGTAWDFNQVRVFTWNTRRHRYETAYREHNVFGYFPVKVGTEDFGGKEGVSPVFYLRKRNEDGTITERKYKMNNTIVREVKSSGEPKAAKAVASKKPAPKKLRKKK